MKVGAFVRGESLTIPGTHKEVCRFQEQQPRRTTSATRSMGDLRSDGRIGWKEKS